MRIAIVGARGHRALAQVLRRVRELPAGVTVVSGGADGVDAVAALAARQRGLAVEEHLPGAGGPLARNTAIAEAADELDAFPWPDCRGTWDTVRKAQARGIPVRVHEPEVDRQALLVFSARRSYAGPGAFCVMRWGGGDEGEPFAPTEDLLKPALAARERADALRDESKRLRSPQGALFESADERAMRGARAASLEDQAEQIEAAAFAAYEPSFRAEMAISRGLLIPGKERWTRLVPAARELAEEAWKRGARPRPQAWDRFLERNMVVITCTCVVSRFCHRTILRETILPKLGAVDGGEVPTR